jgi:hypothetical protein
VVDLGCYRIPQKREGALEREGRVICWLGFQILQFLQEEARQEEKDEEGHLLQEHYIDIVGDLFSNTMS